VRRPYVRVAALREPPVKLVDRGASRAQQRRDDDPARDVA
jgi:hypothetical protein